MKKILLTAFTAVSAALLLISCSDPVFCKIRDEVALEDASINGSINSIVRYYNAEDGAEYLYLDNGRIWNKKADANSHGAWNNANVNLSALKYDYFSSSFSGIKIIKVAADSTYLYALGVFYEEDTEGGNNEHAYRAIYCSAGAGKDWTLFYKTTDSASTTAVSLFCTNTPKNTNRKAYARIGTNVYLLSGTTDPTTGSAINSSTTGADSTSVSCVYFNGSTYFFNYLASSTNETASAEATYFYFAQSSDKLYYSSTAPAFTTSTASTGIETYTPVMYDETTAPNGCKSVDMDTSDIYSIAVSSDFILLGTEGGAEHVAVAAGVPAGATSDFSTNADSIMSSTYEIWTVFSVDPSKTESENNMYSNMRFKYTASSASADYDDVGLWSYYASRGNWNRE